MYSRTNGSIFTVKNQEEKEEIKNVISENNDVSKYYKCIGLSLERFTGKIQKVTLALKDNPQQIISYTVSGEYPTMRLGSEHSSCSAFVIDFPVIKQVTVEVIKKEEPKEVKEPQVEVIQEETKTKQEEIAPQKVEIEDKLEIEDTTTFDKVIDQFKADLDEEAPFLQKTEEEETSESEETSIRTRRRKRKN